MQERDVHSALDAVWRIESPRLIATLARLTGDVGVAEDLAHDAFEAALRQWPRDGVPDRPGAWLLTVGRRRAIDHLRRRSVQARKEAVLGAELRAAPATSEAVPGAPE